MRVITNRSAEAKQWDQRGWDCLDKFTKPEGPSAGDLKKMKVRMGANVDAGAGMGAAQQEKSYATAAQHLRRAVATIVRTRQNKLRLLYPPPLAYRRQVAPNYQDRIWYGARYAAMASPASGS
jgi:hypothetical protein